MVDSGSGQVRYSLDRGIVYACGRELSLSHDGRTLLVLIDERAPDGEVTFKTHYVVAPDAPCPSLDPSLDSEIITARLEEHSRATQSLWDQWIAGQPAIRDFLGSG